MRLLAPSLLLALMAPAQAEVPLPVFPDCGRDNLEACPNEIRENSWDLVSWIPENSEHSVRPAELELGSGIALDVAIQYHTGRWDVPIAVLDSGIEWWSHDLVNKIHLNTGELPLPMDADGVISDTYDLDGNGIVNVQDYRWDPRVDITAGVPQADHILDPSDLIYTFSNGIDDDGNGYIDDIAGWDFHAWDNDPFASLLENHADHGTGVMREAAAEGDNGGRIGTCPTCSIIPVRIGDAFIVDGDRAALGMAYATDAGARVIAMAVGGLSHGENTARAVRYADESGVVLVAAAGDENSYHHNFPAVEDPILYVHSVRGDGHNESSGGVYSYMNFFNCNNYGPRLDLVAISNGCATGAVAKISGAAGLVISAGIDLGYDLEPDEVRALLKGTADDIHLSESELAEARTYPSQEGWDAFYGHGRTNLGRAIEALYAGEIPPIARMTTPEWFAWPTNGQVRVEGRVAAPRAGGVSWALEAGRGAEPDSWQVLAQGDGPTEGLLAQVDPGAFPSVTFRDLAAEDAVDRMHRAHAPMVTLRLTAVDDEGRITEDRRGFWAQSDPDLLDGFPIRLSGSGEASPQLADLTGDGVFEIVVATGSGLLHVFDGEGSHLPGFPVRTDPVRAVAEQHHASNAFASGALDPEMAHAILATPAVGDLTGDGQQEIVAATMGGEVYVWRADGSRLPGFPVAIEGRTPDEFLPGRAWDHGISGAPSLGDINGDGRLEIVVGGLDQRLYVWDADGGLFPGYPLELCHADLCGSKGSRIVASPSLGDVNGNGRLDAVLGTNEVPTGSAGLLYVIDLAAAEVWEGWPRGRRGLINQPLLPIIGEGHPSSVALADVTGDGRLEMASFPMLGTNALLGHDGEDALSVGWVLDSYGGRSNVTDGSFLSMITSPSFGDMTGDGVPDLLIGGSTSAYLVSLPLSTYRDFQHALGGWSGATGESLPGFPRQLEDVSFLVAAAVADVTGDERPEAIYGSGGYFVYAWNADGELAEGWPKFTGGWQLGSAAVGDITGDGWVEVVVTTREGYLFAWRTHGRADQTVQWSSMHGDTWNTGNYHVPLAAQDGPRGCCNRNKRRGRDAALFLVLLPLLGLRRRG